MTNERYLFVGGPLDGRVQEHDGTPLIVEPSSVKVEQTSFGWEDDLATFRVSYQVAIYYPRNVTIGDLYLRAMSTTNPTDVAVLKALVAALDLNLYANPAPRP